MNKFHRNKNGETKACNANKRACRYESDGNINGAHLMLDEPTHNKLVELETSRDNGGTFGKGLSLKEQGEIREIYRKGEDAYTEYLEKEKGKVKTASELAEGDVIKGESTSVSGNIAETKSSPVSKVEKTGRGEQLRVDLEDGSHGYYDADTPVKAIDAEPVAKRGTMDNPIGIERVAGLEEVEATAADLKAGDIIKGMKFSEGGKWRLDEAQVKSVRVGTEFMTGKRIAEVEYTDGTQVEFAGKSQLTLYRKPVEDMGYTYPEMTSNEVYREVRTAAQKIQKGEGLEDEDMDKLVEVANNPSADGMSVVRLKQISSSLEDQNRISYVHLIDAAVERHELSKDLNRNIQNHLALLVDPRTPKDLYERTVKESSPRALKNAKVHLEIKGKPELMRKNDSVNWDEV